MTERVAQEGHESHYTQQPVTFFVPPEYRGAPDGPAVDVQFGDDLGVRQLSPAVLRMATIFNDDPEGRSGLGHDCKAFAYACESGDDLSGVELYRGENPRDIDTVMIGDEVYPVGNGHQDPPVQQGDILCLFRLEGGGTEPGSHHFMVVVSADGGEPTIFASKLRQDEPVRLHTADSAAQYFGAGFAYKVRFGAGVQSS